MVEDLSQEDFDVLAQIKQADDIKTCELISMWEDDHCPCVAVKINGVAVSFWWLADKYAYAFEYAHDSASAKQRVYDCVDYEQNMSQVLARLRKTNDASSS